MNTRPDPDAALDKLLEQAFGGDRLPDAGVACLDAERAAAFVDGGLLAQERAAIEVHVAGCTRCQALVGSTVRMSTPAAAHPAAATRSGWLGWTVPLAAAAGVILTVVLWQGRGADQEPTDMPAMAARDAVSQERPAEPATAPASSPASGRTAALPAATPPAAPPAPAASPVSVGQNAATALERRETTGAGARERDQVRAAPASEALLAKADLVVVSPDAAVRWRVRPGAVEHSTDGGSTWTTAAVGSDIDLAAGSAPSALTCWMVGADGIVLRTTDGRTWQRLAFPETAALVGVEATDERTAAVTTADGRRFRTTDGGVTWVRMPLQETPAAPF